MDVEHTANDNPVVTYPQLTSHFTGSHRERVAMQKRQPRWTPRLPRHPGELVGLQRGKNHRRTPGTGV
jgi:hypothetical protein